MQKNYRVLITFIVTLFTASSVVAADNVRGSTVSLCVRQSGLVYVVGGKFRNDDCKKSDQLLSLGITGPQGPKGDKGVKGDRGEKGDKGDKGDVGATGPQGITGPAGKDGRDGNDGIAGPAGPTGATGPQGERGETGPAGATGPVGPMGPAGSGNAGGQYHVYDANGQDLGVLMSAHDGYFRVLIPSLGVTSQFIYDHSGSAIFRPYEVYSLFFTEKDCVGDVFMDNGSVDFAIIKFGLKYYIKDYNNSVENRLYKSFRNQNGVCVSSTESIESNIVKEVSLPFDPNSIKGPVNFNL